MPNYPKLKSRKIKYNSPSGYALIGKYIPPFEKNATGYGFKGVLIEDSKSGKLQCSLCGEWFEQLPTHINATHEMTGEDYKKNFGLLQSTALKSKKLRLRQSVIMQELRKKYKQCNYKFVRNNQFAGNRKDNPKAVESQNKYGVCKLQLMERILELKKELGKTPTLTDLKDRYGSVIMTNLSQRFGSYIELCRDMELTPNNSNWNPKYSREYFIEKALSNDAEIRIFTTNESRAFYKYFKGGIKELRKIVLELKKGKNSERK